MEEKFFEWIDNAKEKHNLLSIILGLAYKLGQMTWINSIMLAIMGIVVPILYNKNYIKVSVFLIILIIVETYYTYVCNKYKQREFLRRKFAHQILKDQSALLNSILIAIENDKNWKTHIFKTVSELVCEKIYQNFKEIFKCNTRVSVEYIFNKKVKNAPTVKHVKMSGRRSENRSTVKKSVDFEKRKEYYSYGIFFKNNYGINLLDENKINDANMWYKNPKHSVKVKKYIGIAVPIYDENIVKYILQIDFIDDFNFDWNSNAGIKNFINTYLMSYVNLLSISYLLNLNNKKEIPEV